MSFQMLPALRNPTLSDLGLSCAHFVGPNKLSNAAVKDIIIQWAISHSPTTQQANEMRTLLSTNAMYSSRLDAFVTIMAQDCQLQACRTAAPEPSSSNVIPFRKRAGDPAPAEDKSAWGFLALLAVGFGVMEGLKVWSGSYREQERLPGSRIARRNPRELPHGPHWLVPGKRVAVSETDGRTLGAPGGAILVGWEATADDADGEPEKVRAIYVRQLGGRVERGRQVTTWALVNILDHSPKVRT